MKSPRSTQHLPSNSAVSLARAAAYDILVRVEREQSYASELLHSRASSTLTTVDHALATELVMGVLRWRAHLDATIAAASSQSLSKMDLEVLTALRLAVYQLRFLSRIPARAAINESVELVKRARKRSASSFVNAVLRKISAAGPQTSTIPPAALSPAEILAHDTSHPLWMVERWVQAYGLEFVTKICKQDQSVPVTAIRLRDPDAAAALAAEGIELAPGAFLSTTRRILAGDVVHTDSFRKGNCVIQDEASQLVALLVGKGNQILDCCSAPGGKTLALADRNPHSHITAAEIHPHRSRLLQRLLPQHECKIEGIKDGTNSRIHVVTADARRLPFTQKFDRVLADVPCSGTGTLSRNPEIKWRLNQNHLPELRALQLDILRSAMAQVAEGGRIVYSTCSLEREENEEIIEQALTAASSFTIIDCKSELEKLNQAGELLLQDLESLTQGKYLRTLPGLHPCDGFFAAILQRN